MKCNLWQRRLERSRRKAVKLESQQPTKKINASNAVQPGIFELIAEARTMKTMEKAIQPEGMGQFAFYAAERGTKWLVVGRIQKILPIIPKATNHNFQL